MRFLKRRLPRPESLRSHKALRWLGPGIHHPELWRFSRNPVALGVAIGVFFAFIIPVGQFALAAIFAFFFRANLPIAMSSTLITNPLTFAPWYWLAYQIGGFVLPENFRSGLEFLPGFSAGAPLVIGLGILAVFGSVLGYFLVMVFWRASARVRLEKWRNIRSR